MKGDCCRSPNSSFATHETSGRIFRHRGDFMQRFNEMYGGGGGASGGMGRGAPAGGGGGGREGDAEDDDDARR